MLMVDKKIFLFKIKEVYFSDIPFNIEGCHDLNFIYCKKKVDVDGFTCKKELTLVRDLTQDLDTIWQNIRKEGRRHIKRSEEKGIKIRISEEFDQFYKIYKSLFRKKKIAPLLGTFGFGIIPLDTMKKYGTLFVAELDGELLCGDVFLDDTHNVYSWVAASNRLGVDKEKARLIGSASRLCLWEAMKYYKEKSKKEFDLGGIWSEEEAEKDIGKKGINSFKLSLGGEIVTRYSYRKIYSKIFDFTRNLYSLRKLQITNKNVEDN